MPKILNSQVSDDEVEVLEAMSVIPLAWLSAADIAGEMNLEGIGAQQVIPILKALLKKRLVVRGGVRPVAWHLSSRMANLAIKQWDRSPNFLGKVALSAAQDEQ